MVGEWPGSVNHTGAERVVGSGPGVPEGTVENEVLEVLEVQLGIRNDALHKVVIGIRPEPVEGTVEHGILELPSGTPKVVVGYGVIDFGPRPFERAVDQWVAGVLRATCDCNLGNGVLGTQLAIL